MPSQKSKMIASLAWVPKGVSKSIPDAAEPPSREEIEEMLQSGEFDKNGDSEEDEDMDVDADKETDDIARALAAADALGKASKIMEKEANNIAGGLEELDMDNYDDEDEGIDIFGTGMGSTYYEGNERDPYLKDADDSDSEEIEDVIIKAEDSVIVCACNEDDVNYLQIWIAEETQDGESNMYIHHDIILPAFPLCTAWLDCPLKGGEKGNFIAVGSMDPAIEIWDLDIMDEVQPSVILGGVSEKKKKGKKKSIKYKKDSHTSSVLGLAWNKEYRNILASASADKLVKIWDVAEGKCNITMEHHTDKVQTVAWNQHAPQVLLSGSFDHSVVMKDGRAPSHNGFKWPVSADVERVAWDPHNEHSFAVSLENGTVTGFDIRIATSDPSSESQPCFTLHAHDKSVCTISYNPLAPNLLATGSEDKMVKLWDLSNNQPSCVSSRNPKVGAVFSVSFSEDCPFLLAIGGSKGELQLWDTLSDVEVSRRFGRFRSQRTTSN